MSSLDPQNDHRVMDAWCAWLGALATDAEAALAAALAYRQLEGPARDRWLSAVEHDAGRLDVPRFALFAPLLAVEADPARRIRILESIGPAEAEAIPRVAASGLIGRRSDGLRIAVVITPLYLDFVQVLACAYRADCGFDWVRHDPIVTGASAPTAGELVDGAELEFMPLKPLVDELAHAVVAHSRSNRQLPDGLSCFADLFGALGDDGDLHRPI
jgi:hypothetical protein